MDDFKSYGETFQDALDKIDDMLKRGIELSLCLSNEKCEMPMNEEKFLGHHVSCNGI